MQRRCVQARGASRRSSLGSRPRPARAVAIRMAVLVTEKTMRHACESESAKTIIERGHERGTWAGMLKRIEQSEAHLAELLPTNGDDGSSGCGGEGHDGGDADGSSGVERRWPAAVGGGRRVKTTGGGGGGDDGVSRLTMTSGYVSARSFSEISSRTTCTTPDGDTRCHGGQRPCAGRRRKSRCCHRKWEECLPIEFALRFTFCFVRADSTRSSTYMPRLYTRCCQCHHKRVSARPELTTIPRPRPQSTATAPQGAEFRL